MGWIILSIVAIGILFGVLGITRSGEKNKFSDNIFIWKTNKKQFLSLLGIVLIMFGLFTKVPANSVGIKYSPFNGTSEQTLKEGFHGKNVFDKVYKFSTEVQTTTVSNLTTQTKDAQYVNTTLDIKYRVSPTNAYLVFTQFKTLDNMSQTLIVPTTQRILELITTSYNIMDVLGASRSEIYSKLETNLTVELAKYGIAFYSVSISDMDAGEEIEHAITAEAIAKKAVETAEQELLKAQTEAKQIAVKAKAEQDAATINNEAMVQKAEADAKASIVKAEAKAKTDVINAEANAKVIAVKAEAEANANKMLAESITDKVLNLKTIEKWNGTLPTVQGSGSDLIFDMNSLLK